MVMLRAQPSIKKELGVEIFVGQERWTELLCYLVGWLLLLISYSCEMTGPSNPQQFPVFQKIIILVERYKESLTTN